MIYFSVRLVLAALVALPVYLLIRYIYLLKSKKKWEFPREIIMCLFWIFMAGLLSLVWDPGPQFGEEAPIAEFVRRLRTGSGINVVPFATIRQYFAIGWGSAFVINIISNVAVFVPYGFALPLLWKRWQSVWKIFLAGGLLSLGIEFSQMFIGRHVDIDDWILNTLGALLGYGIYRLVRAAAPGIEKLAVEKRQRPQKRQEI